MDALNFLSEIATGIIITFQCFLPLCGAVFGAHYISERSRKNDISYAQFIMLLLVMGFLAYSSRGAQLYRLSTIINKISFAVFALLCFYTLIHIGIKTYQDYGGDKKNWMVGVAIFVAIYVLARIFVPAEEERRAQENNQYEIAQSNYEDGYNDGFGDYEFLSEKYSAVEEHVAHAIAMLDDHEDFSIDEIYDELIQADNILNEMP